MRITVHNRGPEAARLHVLPTLWFRNTWSWGDRRSTSRSLRGRGRQVRSKHPTPNSANTWLYCDGAGRSCSSPRTKRNPARLWNQPNGVPVRQGRVPRLRDRRRARCGQPSEDRDEGRGTLRARGSGGGMRSRSAAAGAARRRRRHLTSVRASIVGQRHASTPTSSTSGSHRARSSEDERRVHRQALAGMLWTQAVLLLRRGAVARRSTTAHPLHRRRIRQWRAEHRVVPHAQRRRHLDARQVGVSVVRGMGPGVPHDLAVARGFRFRQGAAAPDAAGVYGHPNGQMPAYEWNFSDVNPPVHAWATLFLYRIERTSAGRTFAPGALVPGADAQLQLVGEPQGPAREKMFSRAAFWGSTTSASSIAAPAADRRLAGAGRRDGLDGLLLPEHAGDRGELADHDPCTRTSPSSSLEQFIWIA